MVSVCLYGGMEWVFYFGLKCTIGPCSTAPRFFSGQVSGSSTPFLFLGAEFQFWRILTLPEAVYSHTVSSDIMKWPASTPDTQNEYKDAFQTGFKCVK